MQLLLYSISIDVLILCCVRSFELERFKKESKPIYASHQD